MAGLFILLLLFVALVIFLAWVIAAIRLLKKRGNAHPALVIFVLLTPLFVGSICVISWYQSRPIVVFGRTFGFPATRDVSRLESHTLTLGDSGHVYLRFKCAPSTASRIVARGLAPSAGHESSNDPPGWSQPRRTPTSMIYIGNPVKHGFAGEEELFQYDSATGDAYFRWVGVD